jgi:iron complex outermembrane receptor protein
MHLSYALIDSDASTHLEEDLTPNHSGSAAVIYDFASGWQLSGFYYYAYPINTNKFSRLDTRIAKQFPILSSRLTLSATVQHYFEKQSDLFEDNLYSSPNRIYLSADLSF